ncbi:hypothetical protein LOTGIDRAFT_228755 [Lottia gigantea]|uniref:DNA ligase n=1 Tax=Lottia gigantea TaxID=225164 RepID=V4BQT5_LOTGI|nr:hypothetical protein LOTGIDRAFT_228755 [Lottia gigantea]ESO91269.1 hypothetical protein LOTGIDRAFT_228755 [Lottia gigantea]
MSDNRYIVGYAKLGTSSCKKCKTKIGKGDMRIGKVVSNPFSEDGGDMKQWFHPSCIFETFVRARATTKKIEDPDDLEDFKDLKDEDKDVINQLIKDFLAKAGSKTSKTPVKKKAPVTQSKLPFSPPKVETSTKETKPSTSKIDDDIEYDTNMSPEAEKDNSFREFRRLCALIAEENSYTGKTAIVSKYIKKGSNGDKYQGSVYLLLKLLLPGVVKRVYNLNNKQLVKLFSQIFGCILADMVEDLDKGDVAETIKTFFEQSKTLEPQRKSKLSIQQVDFLLEELSKVTKEDDQQRILTKMAKRCTSNDLKMFIRLIKHDLRINSGAKHVLEALDPNAYEAFQASRNLEDVVERVLSNQKEASENGKPGMVKKLSVKAMLMTPVLPMLAEACRSVQQAMKKCPNGFYAEIKYDGERVQVHKKGTEFRYFSRSLKPVVPHKVNHFKDYIPKAFPTGNDLILDAEVLLVDTKTGQPLPFGSLGVHKKAAFQDASVCLFVFDCLHINGINLMEKPLKERRKVLQENMTEVKDHVKFSEYQHITKVPNLQELMDKVFQEGLEGLVLKDVNGLYEPGKRHWLKVKKDYLHEGSMADSADLVVLGAYYGTGNKGGLMSIFLLGVYDQMTKKWCTVTKIGNGLDDKTLDRLQTELDMVKISKDVTKVPGWLNIKKTVVPDFVVADPKNAPVWEIIGAEFSKAEIHTADGISIRFPRVQKIRDDKNWETATDLSRLKKLYEKSKERTDIGGTEDEEDSNSSFISATSQTTPTVSPVKRKAESLTPSSSPLKKMKPSCKYGENCYQTSPAHKKNFDHKAATPVKSSSNKLPDIFTGCKIYLPNNIDKYKVLKRYVIAFNGDIVAEFDKNTATHLISTYGNSINASVKGKTVIDKWLWTCIKTKSLVPTTKYLIT